MMNPYLLANKMIQVSLACLLGLTACSANHQLDEMNDSTNRMDKNTSDMKNDIHNFTKSSNDNSATANKNLTDLNANVQTLNTTMVGIGKTGERSAHTANNKEENLVAEVKKIAADSSASQKSGDAKANQILQAMKAEREQALLELNKTGATKGEVVAEVKKAVADATAAEIESAKIASLLTALESKRKDAASDLENAKTYAKAYEAAGKYMCLFGFRLWNPAMSEEKKKLSQMEAISQLIEELDKLLGSEKKMDVFANESDSKSKFNALVTYLKVQDCPSLGTYFDTPYKSNGLNFYDMLSDLLIQDKEGKLSKTDAGIAEYKPVAILALQTLHNLKVAKTMMIAATSSGIMSPGDTRLNGALLLISYIPLAWFNMWYLDLSHIDEKQTKTIDSSFAAAIETEHLLHETLGIAPALDKNLRNFMSGLTLNRKHSQVETEFQKNTERVLKETN